MSSLNLQKYLTVSVKDNLEARISSIFLLYTSFLDCEKQESLDRLGEVLLESIQDTLSYHTFPQKCIDSLDIFVDSSLALAFHKKRNGLLCGDDISELTDYLNTYAVSLYDRYMLMKGARYE